MSKLSLWGSTLSLLPCLNTSFPCHTQGAICITALLHDVHIEKCQYCSLKQTTLCCWVTVFSDARFDSAYAGHNLLSAPPPPHHTLKTAMLAQLQSQTELYETAATYVRPSSPPPPPPPLPTPWWLWYWKLWPGLPQARKEVGTVTDITITAGQDWSKKLK